VPKAGGLCVSEGIGGRHGREGARRIAMSSTGLDQ
jgi:hypothetical protein